MRRISLMLMVSMVATLLAGAVLAADAPTVVEGNITVIARVTTTAGKVTIQPPSVSGSNLVKPPVTFIVNEKTQIIKDGKVTTIAGLTIGDACRVQVVKNTEGSLVAQILYATTVVPPTKVVKGAIIEKQTYSAWGRTFKVAIPPVGTGPTVLMWFLVSDKTTINVDGQAATYDKLATGQTAEVTYAQPPPLLNPVEKPILAASVAATNPPPPITHVIGRLAGLNLSNGTITVAPSDAGKPAITFKITNETKIDKFGPAPLAALIPTSATYPGDMVDVAAKISPSATVIPSAISVTVSPHNYAGTVDGRIVDPGGLSGTLFVRMAAANAATVAVPFKIVAATRIVKNGVVVGLDKLAAKDSVTMKYFQFPDAKVASLVEAKSATAVRVLN